MTMRADEVLTRLDGLSRRVFLIANMVVAGLVGLAHGSALIISLSEPTSNAEAIRQLSSISLPLSLAVIVTTFVALLRPQLSLPMLKGQSAVVGVSAVALLYWALGIVLNEPPADRFIWTTGLLTTWVAYSTYVVSRYAVRPEARRTPAVYYSPLIAAVIALPLDIAVALHL